MVTNRKEHTQKTPGKQAPDVVIPKPMKIGAATPYDFQGLGGHPKPASRGHLKTGQLKP